MAASSDGVRSGDELCGIPRWRTPWVPTLPATQPANADPGIIGAKCPGQAGYVPSRVGNRFRTSSIRLPAGVLPLPLPTHRSCRCFDWECLEGRCTAAMNGWPQNLPVSGSSQKVAGRLCRHRLPKGSNSHSKAGLPLDVFRQNRGSTETKFEKYQSSQTPLLYQIFGFGAKGQPSSSRISLLC